MHVLSRVRQQFNSKLRTVHGAVKDEPTVGWRRTSLLVDLKKRARATEDDQNEMTKKRKKVTTTEKGKSTWFAQHFGDLLMPSLAGIGI